MEQAKNVFIMRRQFQDEELSREVICVTAAQETLKRATQQSSVLWVDSAVQIAPPLTGVRSFDNAAAAGYIGIGNVFSNVQYSCTMRSRNTTLCNGFESPKGRLQNFDLSGLLNYNLDGVIRQVKATDLFEDTNGYWYVFRRCIGTEHMVYGVLVTDEEHNLVFRFEREDLGMLRTAAGHKILDAMEFCVTSKAWQHRQRVYVQTAA